VDGIAEVELVLSQEVTVLLTGQLACDVSSLLEEDVLQELLEAFGFGLLLRGEGQVTVHDGSPGGVH
jgi:hypothetical protein